MRFPTFHRHNDHAPSSSGDMDASKVNEAYNHPKNMSSEQLPIPPFQYIRESEQDNDHDDLISTMSTMQQKELDSYNPLQRFEYPVVPSKAQLQQHNNDDNNINKKRISVVDEECRTQMLEWCLKMVQYFELHSSIISVAQYYQDRYLGSEQGIEARNNRTLFRVVSVTSLYIAIKLRSSQRWNITAQAFSKLCQGVVSGDEINDTEIKILFSLDWCVNPPIPIQYAEALLDLIFNPSSSRMNRSSLSSCSGGNSCDNLSSDPLPSSLTFVPDYNSLQCNEESYLTQHQELREHIHELVSYQLDIALYDRRLCRATASAIGAAVIINALKGFLYEDVSCSSFCQESIDLTLDIVAKCRIATRGELEDVQLTLLELISPSDTSSSQEEDMKVDTNASDSASNVCHRSDSPPPPTGTTPLVSSSPTSATSKLFSFKTEDLSPQSMLSKVFALSQAGLS